MLCHLPTHLPSIIITFTVVFLGAFFLRNIGADSASVVFTFPEYSYKETKITERHYSEQRAMCEHSPMCWQLRGIIRIHCVRQCINSDCYKEIYGWDELEEGEIDVRLSSFKGCVIKKTFGYRPGRS